MRLIQSLIVVSFLTISFISNAWGPTGHRVVGYVAQQHLTKKAHKKIQSILHLYTLEMCGNHMDFIRSDTQYRHMSSWHYVSIPNELSYEESTKNPKGDVITMLEQIIQELKTKQFQIVENEEFAILALVHLVADIHQPLHVGLADDKGGNMVKVKWFGERTNLHSVWDGKLIDHLKLSYRELGDHVNKNLTAEQISTWQNSYVRDWARESKELRLACYDFGSKMNLGYAYSFRHINTVETRLLQAGIRLAGILNEIYG